MILVLISLGHYVHVSSILSAVDTFEPILNCFVQETIFSCDQFKLIRVFSVDEAKALCLQCIALLVNTLPDNVPTETCAVIKQLMENKLPHFVSTLVDEGASRFNPLLRETFASLVKQHVHTDVEVEPVPIRTVTPTLLQQIGQFLQEHAFLSLYIAMLLAFGISAA